ncbi:MAG: CopG family transcriptional regulator [Pseudobutyrivibrio sp.]|nr:CopG family transcriptional regulator [Pseudobutyrivibrio sp.]
MGRPVEPNPRSERVTLRFQKEEYAELNAYAERHGLTKSQVLLEGLKLLIETENKKKG